MVFGICGAMRLDEFTKLETTDIQEEGDVLLVNVRETKTKKPRSFTINSQLTKIVKKYRDLRPPKVGAGRFFVNYRSDKGTCTSQFIGRNKFALIPRKTAEFLKLADVHLCTCKF